MRFIGSKTLLLNSIEQFMLENKAIGKSFCDLFSGTSTVGRYFKKDYEIISNDLLHFSYSLQKASIENNVHQIFRGLTQKIGIDPFTFLNNIDIENISFDRTPFIYENYSPNPKSTRKYFKPSNALRIDYIRQSIEKWKSEKLLNDSEYYYLLAALIEAIPYVSNIAGTYGAFLKHWDKRASKKLQLVELDIIDNGKNNKSFNRDSNQLIKKICGDILYIDPPYNTRQYAPNYHLLETVSRYDSKRFKSKRRYRHLTKQTQNEKEQVP